MNIERRFSMETQIHDVPEVQLPDVENSIQTDAEQTQTKAHRRLHLPDWLKSRENVSRAAFLLGPWASYLMVEYLNNNDPFDSLTAEQVALNLIWYYLIFWVFRMVIGRKGLASGIASGACFLFGLANHYVLTFRGRVIFPCDLLCLGTAANVAQNYDYSPDEHIWKALAVLAAYWAVLLLSRLVFRHRGRQKLRIWTVLGSSGVIAVFCGVFFFTSLLPSIGIYAQQWKTQANGFLLNFMTALRYSFVSAPDGYSAAKAEEIASGTEDYFSTAAEPPENLIVIMNESLADMEASFPDLNLTSDPLEFYHSMTENTVKGLMVPPVTGGGTANVEFEYLTGDSLAFLPSSTVAYQLYLYDGVPSMVSQLKGLGYHSIAFHPYLASGWNRTSVYDWMGFDEQRFVDDVKDPQYIRQYVSDSSDYQQIYRMTDETNGPTFVFNVTMQNHSGYAQGWNNLEKSVSVEGMERGTGSVTTQYFSLVKESDNAIRELIEHYSASNERTMIVLFGDHQPPLGNQFYESLYGKPLDDRTTEEVLQEYEVPFFIWANYDIPEQSDLMISSNFLGTLTAELAGFNLTGYQQLHAQLMDMMPVATTIGFRMADGTLTDDETTLPEPVQALYQKYRTMAYNHLFDERNHPDGFYD
jgi:phosphoglycerol transferase MdoB-like AlkP superfamily enzyme